MLEPDAARRALRWVLVAGAVLHLIAAAAMCEAGRMGFMPEAISPQGVLRGDGEDYLDDSLSMGRHATGFLKRDAQVHERFYAVSSFVLTPVVGESVFSFELVNLPLYLLTLFLTFKLGETCYDARAGLAAAALVGLLPTLLMHSTQPLRDPLFIVLMLTFILTTLRLLMRRMNSACAASEAARGVVLLVLICLVRDSMWLIYVGIAALALVMLSVASLRDGRFPLPNFACLMLLLTTALLVPTIFAGSLPPKEDMSDEQVHTLEKFTGEQTQAGLSGVLLKISVTRQKFIVLYPEAGSNIDAGRSFRSLRDVFVYLPRAVVVGLFAPFPAKWIEAGTTFGRAGRLIAGVEMCFTYLMTIFAAACAWRTRRTPQTWLLVSIVLLGATALGLVVVNVGALYRMRYTFVILLVILGAERLSRSVSFTSLRVFNARTREQSA
ncbi:MAG: hypothetical protein QOE33_321 [Acidobacteriota bacterium]|nr:hypothetical protein [Acidobacteriota bacterium]